MGRTSKPKLTRSSKVHSKAASRSIEIDPSEDLGACRGSFLWQEGWGDHFLLTGREECTIVPIDLKTARKRSEGGQRHGLMFDVEAACSEMRTLRVPRIATGWTCPDSMGDVALGSGS